ncbi:MAG: 4Fe-4S binding protein [Acidimicrobiia bacterium]|nr:4Fe-4S binding protein [Acidimicrobiia bacterium]
MALRITVDCIACGACQYACPNDAVRAGIRLYSISIRNCNECRGQFDVPQCVEACPVDCIVPRPLAV